MEKTQQAASHTHMTSTAAFVEGGIQEACVDACSICLEDFCESDPSTVTSCRHEFHLQCVLEWSQRSSQCPMCLQPISLKDPTSQELLEAVEQERNLRLAPSRSAVILHHPTLGDFELQHLPVSGNDSELEEHIIRHLAAAAAMGRTRHIRRREGHRNRSSSHARPQFLVFPPQPNAPSDGTVSASMSHVGRESEPSAITVANPSTPLLLGGAGPSYFASASEPSANSTDQQGFFFNDRSSDHASPPSQDRAGPSDFLSFSGSLKSRWSSLSMRYKESISKSTRGWKEKLFSQNASMTDVGAAVQREVKTGIASVSRMIEHLGIRESSECSKPSIPNQLADHAIVGHGNQTNQTDVERWNGSHLNDNNM